MKIFHHLFLAAAGALLLTGCGDDLVGGGPFAAGNRIQLSGSIEQIAVTRASDAGFADGDVMGVYVVDYEGNNPGTLKVTGNRGDNVRHTYRADGNKWEPAYDLYWKDEHTHIDVYGYYPYASPENVEAYPFEVRHDQSQTASDGVMGGYEASDFLWAKVADVAPTTRTIRLPMTHRMSCAHITLVKGAGFADGEWENTERTVLVANVARKANINLTDGSVSVAGGAESAATVAARMGDDWRAIVIPQTVTAGTTLFSITIGGVPYKFSRQDNLTYAAGRMMNFSIRVDKRNEATGQYQLTLISESITPWENDLVSHDAVAKEYVVIHATPGHLKDAIIAAGKDYTRLKDLKITGSLKDSDFYFMRDQMTNLQALNLKEVDQIKASYTNDTHSIPDYAFYQKHSLTQVVLPDHLEKIGTLAFDECTSLSGSLYIPEGVTVIGGSAFNTCTSLTGTLSLPSTLKEIGYTAFYRCGFTCNLILPDHLERIGDYAFQYCGDLYGELRLPRGLKYLGMAAFGGCSFTGSLEIPQGITEIRPYTFENCGFNGTLTLHDGITTIGDQAFCGHQFAGELRLPKNLVTIGASTFSDCYFSGNLKLPRHLRVIGSSAFFQNIWLTGVVEFPEGLLSIGSWAFWNCASLEGLDLPESLENINNQAFAQCSSLRSIVCRSAMPPRLGGSVFDDVPKDNVIVEVPEGAVAQYQAADGWREFKHITAHHELVTSRAAVNALAGSCKQTLRLQAEGKWEVADKPDWCEVSPASGKGKAEVTLTFSPMAQNGAKREGNVTFRLKDVDYTHSCKVTQYGYAHAADEWLTLQKATRGKRGGINIVLLGDGFDAQDIASGRYLDLIKQQAEHFFSIEPYKTYRSYFNVYTAFPLSNESGVNTVNTSCDNRFGTRYEDYKGLKANYDDIFAYALGGPTVNKDNLSQTLIIMVPNSTSYEGITRIWIDGSTISFCPESNLAYPLDSRGVVQHEAGGHGFGKLADEGIRHKAFIDGCDCLCCGHNDAVNQAKAWGWYDNISLTGKSQSVTWSHLLRDSRYSSVVDIYEGAFGHSRGVFRSEQNSCMNNDIPYYNAISRESIVRRIKQYAGETFSFEDFVQNDQRGVSSVARTRAVDPGISGHTHQHAPVIHQGSPLRMSKVRRHR